MTITEIVIYSLAAIGAIKVLQFAMIPLQWARDGSRMVQQVHPPLEMGQWKWAIEGNGIIAHPYIHDYTREQFIATMEQVIESNFREHLISEWRKDLREQIEMQIAGPDGERLVLIVLDKLFRVPDTNQSHQ